MKNIATILGILQESTTNMVPPMSTLIAQDYGRDPFLILISCLLSLRARDPMTYKVSVELFKYATTPQQILAMSLSELESILRPLGFYKKKARVLLEVSAFLIKHFNSTVPSTEHELLSIPGVGIKTAHLVLGEAFGIPALCVDTHVHRISNRLGWVRTKTPEQTHEALRQLIPKEYWIRLNHLLVMWGQNICTPLSPRCSICPLNSLCPKIGVTTSR